MRLAPSPTRKWNDLLLAAKNARLPYEREAWLNMAFYLNEQYTEWSPELNNIRRIPRDTAQPNAPRPVVNKIMQYVRQLHHEAVQDKPTGDVLPPTDDYQDIADSLVAKAWIENQAEPTQCDFDDQLSRGALWAVLCGTGWLKWCWNARKKRMDIVPCSFFEVYIDPYAKQYKHARYIIHSQFMDPEQVYEAWGKEIPNNKLEAADPARVELLQGMGSMPALKGVTVNELWYRPCRRYPKGLYCVWSGNEFLVEPDLSVGLPYPHLREYDMLPFTILGCLERPDSAYYISPVQYLRPSQMELNKYHAQRLTFRDKFAQGKWWVPNELDLENMPDDSPAQVLKGEGASGLEPKLILPGAWMPNDDGDMLEAAMMNIVGQHEVSQAQVPGRVEAAKAIEMLKDADANSLATLRKTINTANSVGWFQALELARVYAPQEQMVTAYSREGMPEVKRFRAGAMSPGFRVRTSTTTGLAHTRAARQDLLIQLWQNKAIVDPEALAEMMEIPLPNMLQTRAADIRLARNENLRLANGIAIQPNSWDDHAIHLREHNAYRKTTEFMGLSKLAKMKFEHHCTTHDDMLDVELEKQAKRQMIMQGQVPPGAEPPAEGDPAAAAQDQGGDQGAQPA